MLISSNNIIKEVEYLRHNLKKSNILPSIKEITAELFNYYWPCLLVRQPINNKKKSLAPHKFKKIKIPDINKFFNKPNAKKDFEI